jgi:hypothetical protein
MMKNEKLKQIFSSKLTKSLAVFLVVLLIGAAVYVNYKLFYDPVNGMGYGDGNMAAIVKDYGLAGGKVMTLEPHLFDFTGLSALENGNVTSLGISPYKDNDEAFDAAADALKTILTEIRRSL